MNSDTPPHLSEPALPDSSGQREQALEAQIAELKQDKERLLGLLDQALTALNRPEHDPYRLPSMPTAQAPARTGAKPPKEELVPGTWAWLKNWFLNA